MAFHIGELYRFPEPKEEWRLNPPKTIDGLRNFFYETRDPEEIETGKVLRTTFRFQKGIHAVAPVRLSDGSERIPVIIISSSPHKSGTDSSPWEDTFDSDYGHIKYYGDNKDIGKAAASIPGNKLLLDEFQRYAAPTKEARLKSVPLVFFRKQGKGFVFFHGFGVIETASLVTQFNPKLTTSRYFSNYVFDMCVFSMAEENEKFSWEWILKRRDPSLSDEEVLKFAPASWQRWVKYGRLAEVRRHIVSRSVYSKGSQIPEDGSPNRILLDAIYKFYENRKHSFELLALKVTEMIFSEAGIEFTPGWVTEQSGDGGVDFVGRMDISSQLSGLKIVVLGQAKCESLNRPTNGLHIARTVARLKRGWFGVYVTTSYFSEAVQLEVQDDQYPIMLVSGDKLASCVSKLLYGTGLSPEDFLSSLDKEYRPQKRRPEEILSLGNSLISDTIEPERT